MNIENKHSEPWVSTKEIAQHLGVTIDTIRNWIKKETIPCHQVGRLWKFKVSEVDAWVISDKAKEDEISNVKYLILDREGGHK